jgi:hypothetical protein
MISLDSAFWWNSITILAKCIFFLSVYSLIINCIFGHRSFWWTNNFKSISQQIFSGSLHVKHSIKSSNSTEKSFSVVDDDVMLIVLEYLTSNELSITSCTFKRFQMLSAHPILWNKLYKLTFSTLNGFPHYANPSLFAQQPKDASSLIENLYGNGSTPLCVDKMRFYRLVDKYPVLILDAVRKHNSLSSDDHKLVVLIRGEVFDLTTFAHRHPGGIYILQEGMQGLGGGGTVSRMGDATRLFEIANHSAAALIESRKYVLWSPLPFVGRRGMPRAVRLRLIEQQNTT